ncbi:sensor domain-containing diguanylate cyclase [Vibrio rotiferianus]|uniref:sensor domain-containing diguanylate cyclase n=1 Tax=Vibrio rotiferianus TaxID=190895 RepID=UPI002895CA21|nr:Diguanylate cyclase [Vibrio rotiferianus]
MTRNTLQEPFFSRYKATLSAFGASVIITWVFVFVAYVIQQKYTVTIFDSLAQRQAESLKTYVKTDLAFIGSGANFFHSIDKKHWDRFPIFARQVIDSSPSLIGLQWMQKVTPQQLPEHVKQVRKTFPNFEVFTVPKDQPKTFGYILPDDKPVYIASDIYPRTLSNIDLLGFYSSRLRFDLILEDIIASGGANISDKVRLLQDGYDRSLDKTGLLVYHPVFEQESRELLGVVVGVVRSTVYFDDLITKTATELEMLVKVSDLGFDAYDDPVLFQSEDWDSHDGAIIKKTIQLPNRDWLIEFKLSDMVSPWDRSVLYGIAFGGLIISVLVAYIVNLQSREKERLAKMLEAKTRELTSMAERDPLTHLYNRRAFNDHLLHFINDGVGFTLIGFDIDCFKQINDKHGHLVGDEALIHVTKLVSANLNKGDRFYRSGGDEFCILSRVTDKPSLEAYLEKLRGLVASSPMEYSESIVLCSLSIGAALHDGEDPEALFQKMDVQLYLSKKNGRNLVSIAD